MAGTGSLWSCHSHRGRLQALGSESLGVHGLRPVHCLPVRASGPVQQARWKMGVRSEVPQDCTNRQFGSWQHGMMLASRFLQSLRPLPGHSNAPSRTEAKPQSFDLPSVDYPTDLEHYTAYTVKQPMFKYLALRCTSLHSLRYHSTAATIS